MWSIKLKILRKWFADACGEGANSNLLVIYSLLRGLTVNERLLDGNSLCKADLYLGLDLLAPNLALIHDLYWSLFLTRKLRPKARADKTTSQGFVNVRVCVNHLPCVGFQNECKCLYIVFV